MFRRPAALLAAVCLLAGCGEEAAGEGQARLWITRDRGSEVVMETQVPAGISALEALRREADIETRYGGRFVHSIDGIEGDIADQHDWFWFVNGYEGDLSAADYRLHPGDVVWWDYRSWAGQMRQPVVVGAFPEPFVHGWAGKRRPALVIYHGSALAELAKRIAAKIDASVADLAGGHPLHPPGTNVLTIVQGNRVSARLSGGPGGQVSFVVGSQAARRLAEDPSFLRYRYAIP